MGGVGRGHNSKSPVKPKKKYIHTHTHTHTHIYGISRTQNQMIIKTLHIKTLES